MPIVLPYFAGGLALGAAAGVAFALAWRWFFPPGAQSRFWIRMSALSHDMMQADTGREFFSVYKRLAVTLGGYLARNLAVTAIGGAALLAALFLGLAPLAKSLDVRGEISVQPAGMAAAVQATPGDKVALCRTDAGCFGLSLLGFETRPSQVDGPVIARSRHGDVNPFWPYLSDLEALFFAAFILAMSVGVLWPDKRRARLPTPMLKAGDFALVQINEAFRPLVRFIGDLETRRLKHRLPAVERPIFITGLARSGTTTVLNALTRSPELGSHQYRDFPFLGAPLTWSKLQGAISKGQTAVERPHKDRILITKVSPEAYEEPLWQQFFSHVHDPARNQRLTAKTSRPRFEAFFREHLAKILLLRGAGRYVSKGNYNIGRIEYLARMFPDARFITPVREPVAHIASLVRQHELFCAYAADDPRVPIYLRSAGHYEFGPQRRAIALTKETAAEADQVWSQGDVVGYARQWAEVYGHLARLLEGPLADRILVVRYEDFCASPEGALKAVTDFCGLEDPTGAIAAFAEEVSLSDAPTPSSVEAQRATILDIVATPARVFGYAAPARPLAESKAARLALEPGGAP